MPIDASATAEKIPRSTVYRRGLTVELEISCSIVARAYRADSASSCRALATMFGTTAAAARSRTRTT
jgi:hypothetical protein